MWRMISSVRWLVVVCACGGSEPKVMEVDQTPPPTPITVEWKVEQGEGHQVDVALLVEGRKFAIGTLEAATELEAGTPATCGLRAASPRRTELVCGEGNGFSADLVGTELLVTFNAGAQRSEIKRIPVYGDHLSVKPLSLPYPAKLSGP
jgi:hypothetical protein